AVELGLLGALAFLICLAGVARTAARAVLETEGHVRGVTLGLSVGLLAMLGQQAVDFSIWVDPLLYAAALAIGLLNLAPELFGGDPRRTTRADVGVERRSAAEAH